MSYAPRSDNGGINSKSTDLERDIEPSELKLVAGLVRTANSRWKQIDIESDEQDIDSHLFQLFGNPFTPAKWALTFEIATKETDTQADQNGEVLSMTRQPVDVDAVEIRDEIKTGDSMQIDRDSQSEDGGGENA